MRDSFDSKVTTTPERETSCSDLFSVSDFNVNNDSKMESYLFKTPGSKKKPGSWQKRWFVMKSTAIYYYKQPKVSLRSFFYILILIFKIGLKRGW